MIFAFFGNGGHPAAECRLFFLLNFTLDLPNGHLVLAEVHTVKRLQSWHPNLPRGPEIVVLLLLAGEHRIDRVLHQVEMLQIWVLQQTKGKSQLVSVTQVS